MREALTGHMAKEEVMYDVFKRVMNTGITLASALFAILLSIIGYLLVHPIGLR
jgi:amino acid permease